jgi:hypothetical protein
MALTYKTFRAASTVFCAILVSFFAGLGPVQAADELYTVEGVKVDVTADSAMAARDQAFDKAQIDAFTTLAGRMLSESELENWKAPAIDVVSPMVQDYEVTAEKLSSVRYIGTYTITFRAKSVDSFFNKQGSTYSNVVSAPLVILPFWQVSGRNYLWSPYNIWMRAWNRVPASGTPVPVIVPIGDLEDVSDISDDDVFGYNPDKLAALLKRYDAGDAVLAVATPDGKLANAKEEDIATGGAVTVSLYRTDRGSPEHVREIVVQAQPGDTLGKLLDRAVGDTQTALKQNWKEKTAVPAAQTAASTMPAAPSGNSLVARIQIASLEQWATTQKALSRVNAITGTELKSLSPKEALVKLSYRGDEPGLRTALAQAGMDLGFPKYAGYGNATNNDSLIYELSFGGRPVMQQPQQYQSLPQEMQPQAGGYQGGYQQQRPRDQLNTNAKPPGGYPVPPRTNVQPQMGNGGYTGQF